MFTEQLAKGRVQTVLLLPSADAQRLRLTEVRKVSSIGFVNHRSIEVSVGVITKTPNAIG